ncbi:MAG: hypothetical protein ACYTG0_32430, partial [Planctomycetota bacterium]
MAACSKRAPTGIRNRALIAILYRGQLRISEALALKPKDLAACRVDYAVAGHQGATDPPMRVISSLTRRSW